MTEFLDHILMKLRHYCENIPFDIRDDVSVLKNVFQASQISFRSQTMNIKKLNNEI